MEKQPPNINNQRIYAKKFDKNLENKWENTNFALILKKTTYMIMRKISLTLKPSDAYER